MKAACKRKIIAVLCCISLLFSLAGCQMSEGDETNGIWGIDKTGSEKEASDSYNGENKTGKGMWVETDVTPEGVDFILNAPQKMPDGTICFYAKEGGRSGKLYRYTSADDGVTWSKQELDFEEKLGGSIYQLAFDEKGDMLIKVMHEEESTQEEVHTSFYYQKANETGFQECQQLKNHYCSGMYFIDESTVLLGGLGTNASDERSVVYDLENGEIVKELQNKNNDDLTYLKGVSPDKSNKAEPALYLTYYDKEYNSILCRVDGKGNFTDNLAKLPQLTGSGVADPDGNYYFAYEGNIARIAAWGSLQEQIMDDNGFVLGLSNYYDRYMGYCNDNTFLCVLSDMNGNKEKLIRYSYDANAVAHSANQKRLIIWSLENNDTVKNAISKAKSEMSDVKIEYQIGIGDTDDVTREDAIKQLQADMLSKDGPDIIILDGLDYENYKKRGFLSELNSQIDTSGLLAGIINGMKDENGTLYAVPVRFSVPIMVGVKEQIAQVNSLSDLKDQILARAPRKYVSPSEEAYYEKWTEDACYGIGVKDLWRLIDFTMESSGAEIIREGKISESDLREVVDFISSVAVHYEMQNYKETNEDNSVMMSGDGTDVIEMHDGFYEYQVTGHARYGWDLMETPGLFMTGQRIAMKDKEVDFIYRPGLCENAYIPKCLAAIRAGSRNQEIAARFIQIMLSEKVQDDNMMDGCCVNRNSLEKSVQKHLKQAREHGYQGDMMAFFEKAQTPVFEGNLMLHLKEYIYQHVTNMLNGTENLTGAVSGIEEDMSLMLREQE